LHLEEMVKQLDWASLFPRVDQFEEINNVGILLILALN
jgi:hypothetical protein